MRFNTIGLLAGAVTLNYDVKIAEQWTLGPELTYWDINLTSNDGNSYDIYALGGGLRATWFAYASSSTGCTSDTSLAVARKHLKATNSDGSTTLDRTALVATGIVGYAWYWTSFNVHLGGGASVDLGDRGVGVKTTDGTETTVHTSLTRFTAETSIGWTF